MVVDRLRADEAQEAGRERVDDEPGAGDAPGQGTLAPVEGRWRWYHGLLFYMVVQALSAGFARLLRGARPVERGLRHRIRVGQDRTREFYLGQRRPFFAPPTWAFLVMWTINNGLAIWGSLHVLNRPAGTPGRSTFL